MFTTESLQGIIKQFQYYKTLSEKAMDQIPEEKLFWQYHEDCNSIAIIIKHLWGNMKSRWTDFLTTDGEKEWRERDAEFENDIKNKAQLLEKWNEGWQCLFEALTGIHENNINQPVYIRNVEHSIPEAIHRQLAHYAYHAGQLVFLCKLIAKDQWQSLTIPKGASTSFNQEHFKQPKHKGHFTDDLLKHQKDRDTKY